VTGGSSGVGTDRLTPDAEAGTLANDFAFGAAFVAALGSFAPWTWPSLTQTQIAS